MLAMKQLHIFLILSMTRFILASSLASTNGSDSKGLKMDGTMRRSCLQMLCLGGDGMFFGNSGAKPITTRVNKSHFIISVAFLEGVLWSTQR